MILLIFIIFILSESNKLGMNEMTDEAYINNTDRIGMNINIISR